MKTQSNKITIKSIIVITVINFVKQKQKSKTLLLLNCNNWDGKEQIWNIFDLNPLLIVNKIFKIVQLQIYLICLDILPLIFKYWFLSKRSALKKKCNYVGEQQAN